MKKSLILALGLFVTSQSVVAGTIPILSWDYVNEAGFVDPTTDAVAPFPVNSLGPDGVFDGSSSDGFTSILSSGDIEDNLCWGEAVDPIKGPSCLTFEDTVGTDTSRTSGSIATTGAHQPYIFADGTSMKHNNFGINPPKLVGVNLLDSLRLDNAALLAPFFAPEINFSVAFNESKNDCSNLEPWCPNDVFVITASTGVDIINVDVANKFVDVAVDMDLTGFVPAGYHTDYQIVTRLSGLEPIPGLPPGTFGLITEEGTENFLRAQFAVRLVPEPSTIALFGLGLMLLSIASKRRKMN